MIIDLPEKFRYEGENSHDYAEIQDGIVHIYGNVSFRKLMYGLTYAIKGNEECYYCKGKIKKNKLTLDHMYPETIGGPTIPNNLVPCCEECNSEKNNLTSQQYMTMLTLNKNQRHKFRELIQAQHEVVWRGGGFEVPRDWIEISKTSKFLVNVEMEMRFRGKKYAKIKAKYREYKSLIKPIVIDRNGFVLDGFTTLMFAKEEEIQQLAVIRLENVQVHVH